MDLSLADRRYEALTAASRSLAELWDADPVVRRRAASDEPLPDPHEVLNDTVEDLPALRRERRRLLLDIAVRDLTGELTLAQTGGALAALADACLGRAMALFGPIEDFTVIAMGKLGGRELNYSSDIDLMFVTVGDAEEAGRYAARLVHALTDFTPDGQMYRVDLDLRPEGRSGALVRSLDGYIEYYRRWAKQWEFQALIKARPCAGDGVLGASFMEAVTPFVFGEIDEDRVAEIRRMKERVESHAAQTARRARSSEAADVKLGPGGIRDIEFSVQLLQLVHGPGDPSVRSGNTLEALAALADGGYLAEDDGDALARAYTWLRDVEHRLQLWQERQTHTLPTEPDPLGRIARTLGLSDSPATSAAEAFERAHSAVLSDVRNRFSKLFYTPMVESLAEPGGIKLSAEALNERLRVLGFRDVEKAARTLTGLVTGTSRRAKLLRVLTPALLRSLAVAPQPDQGLFAFLNLGTALGERLDLLGSLRDNPPALAALGRVLGSGRFLGEVLIQVPEEIAVLTSSEIALKDRSQLVAGATASLGWRGEEGKTAGLRRFKRKEMMRIALADVTGGAGIAATGSALADLADACLEAALQERPVGFAVIGMGKLGGRELHYPSDLDVMFVTDGDPHVAESLAEATMRAIGEVTPEGQAFRMDAGLRPEGKSGRLCRSIESYLEYYDRWAEPWEHQALIKARPVAGDLDIAAELVARTRHLAFPERLREDALLQVRHLKARMEKERIPRGSDPRRNFKMGAGGLADIEFAVQVLQLKHAHHLAFLQVPGTLDAIDGARIAEVLSDDDASHLNEAYVFLTRLRNRLFFLTARPVEALPARPEDLEALGVALGFSGQPRQELEDTYLRLTRRARMVCERVVYGGRAGTRRSSGSGE